jgi:hypothetical protein
LFLGRTLRLRALLLTTCLLSLGLAAFGGLTFALGQPREVWLALWLLAGLCAALPLAHVPLWDGGGRLLLGLLRSPRGQGALLVVLSVAASSGWAYWTLERVDPIEDPEQAAAPVSDTAFLYQEVTPSTARTDRGRPIRLFRLGNPDAVSQREREWEARLNSSPKMVARMIRTADADLSTNCFGWVFAGGRYVIKSGEVKKILEDNGYEPVAEPSVGDLVVYTDGKGGFVHVGIVRVAGGETPVLVESKWGHLGRYLHEPAIPVYAYADCAFYHSPRAGHALVGLGDGQIPSGGSNSPGVNTGF